MAENNTVLVVQNALPEPSDAAVVATMPTLFDIVKMAIGAGLSRVPSADRGTVEAATETVRPLLGDMSREVLRAAKKAEHDRREKGAIDTDEVEDDIEIAFRDPLSHSVQVDDDAVTTVRVKISRSTAKRIRRLLKRHPGTDD